MNRSLAQQQGRIPAAGDSVRDGDFILEVMDMDGYRIDKLRIRRVAPVQDASAQGLT